MKLGWLMLSLAVGWGAALGCSEEEPIEPTGEAGGAGAPVVPVGEGGSGGGGAEPVGGTGAEPVGGGGGALGEGGAASCEAEPFECDECPTLEQLLSNCAMTYRVACDRLLVEPQPVGASNRYGYCFDAQGVLIGKVEEVDVPNTRTVTGADCGPRNDTFEFGCVGGAGGAGP